MIELHIKCHNDDEDNERLREIGIDTPPITEYRKLRLRKDYIVGFYPNAEGGCFVFLLNGDEITVNDDYDTLWDLCR